MRSATLSRLCSTGFAVDPVRVQLLAIGEPPAAVELGGQCLSDAEPAQLATPAPLSPAPPPLSFTDLPRAAPASGTLA